MYVCVLINRVVHKKCGGENRDITTLEIKNALIEFDVGNRNRHIKTYGGA